MFQCSSASRKFLNRDADGECQNTNERFSALQRAENSSIVHPRLHRPRGCRGFSALQRAENSSIGREITVIERDLYGFSALQRAENSSIVLAQPERQHRSKFQCSSASRKFLNRQN